MDKKTFLLTGGVRSGKSGYALEFARDAQRPFFIATGWPGDKEMQQRISKHRFERNDLCETIEEQIKLSNAIKQAINSYADLIIIDCLGAWITNLMVNEGTNDIRGQKEILKFIETVKKSPVTLVIVTNEVGMGIVPGDEMSRSFRDNLGFLNQSIAKIADKVIFMVSGLPLEVK